MLNTIETNRSCMFFILSMEETIRTSQFGFFHTVFCRVFHDGSSEKNKNSIICLCRDIFKIKLCFFEHLLFHKLVSRFSENMGSAAYLQHHPTPVQYNVKYFFLFESSCLGLPSLAAPFLKISLFIT
jgi:hypothetical protein